MLGFSAISEFAISGIVKVATKIVTKVKTVLLANDFSQLITFNKNSNITSKLEYTTTVSKAKNATILSSNKCASTEVKNKFILKQK